MIVERFAAAVCDEGIDVDSMPRDHLHQARRRRAARADPRGAARARPPRPRHARSTAPGSRPSTASATGCSRPIRSRPGLDPRFRELDEAQAAVVRGEAFDEALERFCAGGRSGAAATARHLPRRRAAADAHRRLRDAARRRAASSCSSSASARRSQERVEELRDAARCLADDERATELARANAGSAARASSPANRFRSGCSTSRRTVRRASAPRATRRRGRRSSRPRSTSSPRTTATCSSFCSTPSPRPTRPRRRESRRSTSRTSSWSRATSCATTPEIRAKEQLRFRAIMVDEFQDTNRLQCELIDLLAEHADVFVVGDEFQSIYGFRHADVAVFRERRRGRRRRARADPQLPLASGGARSRQPPLRQRVRRGLPAARRLG